MNAPLLNQGKVNFWILQHGGANLIHTLVFTFLEFHIITKSMFRNKRLDRTKSDRAFLISLRSWGDWERWVRQKTNNDFELLLKMCVWTQTARIWNHLLVVFSTVNYKLNTSLSVSSKSMILLYREEYDLWQQKWNCVLWQQENYLFKHHYLYISNDIWQQIWGS